MNIVDEIKKREHLIPFKSATVGFDGCIDNLFYVIKNRKNSNCYKLFKSIEEFSNFITKSGTSCGLEIVFTEKKIGGNGPILANALEV